MSDCPRCTPYCVAHNHKPEKKLGFLLIEFPVFGDYIVHVEEGKDFVAMGQKYKIEGIEDTDQTCDGLTVHKKGVGFSFIFFKPNPCFGNIAHEAYHAVRHMLRWSGCDLDNETVAYHLGYVVNCICSHLKKGKQPRVKGKFAKTRTK
jgi:hypothetical protein